MSAQYTQKESDFVKKHFPNKKDDWIAKKLGRSQASVRAHARIFKLNKSPEYMEKVKEQRIKNLLASGHKTRFKKGVVSYMKGKKLVDVLSDETLKKVQKTQFKKGDKPANELEIGEERVYNRFGRKYIYIKVEKGKPLVPKHVHVWTQANGPIPEGFVIRFKDENYLNCELENLYLSERNTILNSYAPWRYPEGGIVAMRLIKKAKKALAEYKNTGKIPKVEISDFKSKQ